MVKVERLQYRRLLLSDGLERARMHWVMYLMRTVPRGYLGLVSAGHTSTAHLSQSCREGEAHAGDARQAPGTSRQSRTYRWAVRRSRQPWCLGSGGGSSLLGSSMARLGRGLLLLGAIAASAPRLVAAAGASAVATSATAAAPAGILRPVGARRAASRRPLPAAGVGGAAPRTPRQVVVRAAEVAWSERCAWRGAVTQVVGVDMSGLGGGSFVARAGQPCVLRALQLLRCATVLRSSSHNRACLAVARCVVGSAAWT
eukprot:scaffold1500_cov398-Prasinococcus_capsulatus_cf.AAC.6